MGNTTKQTRTRKTTNTTAVYKKIQKLYKHIKDTRQRNRNTYVNKMKLNGQIGALNRKWNNRKIEQQAKELQNAADNNNMKPLWDYRKNQKTQKQIKTLHVHRRR